MAQPVEFSSLNEDEKRQLLLRMSNRNVTVDSQTEILPLATRAMLYSENTKDELTSQNAHVEAVLQQASQPFDVSPSDESAAKRSDRLWQLHYEETRRTFDTWMDGVHSRLTFFLNANSRIHYFIDLASEKLRALDLVPVVSLSDNDMFFYVRPLEMSFLADKLGQSASEISRWKSEANTVFIIERLPCTVAAGFIDITCEPTSGKSFKSFDVSQKQAALVVHQTFSAIINGMIKDLSVKKFAVFARKDTNTTAEYIKRLCVREEVEEMIIPNFKQNLQQLADLHIAKLLEQLEKDIDIKLN